MKIPVLIYFWDERRYIFDVMQDILRYSGINGYA